MPKTKHTPGIHLHKTTGGFSASSPDSKPEYYWNIIASNGKEIARSSETYSTKANAVKSIKAAGRAFWEECTGSTNWGRFYDHSKKDSPLKSYL